MDIRGFQSPRASATINYRLERMLMKEYTAKEMKVLKANPYTFKVTKNKLYFTIEFKKAFWIVLPIYRKRNETVKSKSIYVQGN